MRTSLLPGALMTVSNNLKVREHNLKMYEIGNIIDKKIEGDIDTFEDFTEEEFLTMLVTGNANENEWFVKEREFDIYDLKEAAGEFLSNLDKEIDLTETLNHEDDGTYAFSVYLYTKDKVAAKFGAVNEKHLKYFDIDQPVYAAEINLTLLKTFEDKKKIFNELLKYPKVIRDFAFVLDKNITAAEVEKTIKRGSSKLLKNIKLFDIFESDSLGKGKKSLAFQLEYFDESGTLTEKEVDKDFRNAIATVETKLNAQLRGG